MTEGSPRRAQTRQALIDAAIHVIATKGLDASIEEFSEAAQFTRGAFYSNFSSKIELFAAILDQESDRAMTAMREAIPVADLAQVGLVELAVDNYLRLWGTSVDAQIALYAIRLAATREPELRAHLQRIDGLYREALLPVLTAAIRERGIQTPLSVETIAMVVRAVALTAFVDGIVDGELDTSLVREQLIQVLGALLEPTDSAE